VFSRGFTIGTLSPRFAQERLAPSNARYLEFWSLSSFYAALLNGFARSMRSRSRGAFIASHKSPRR